MNDTSLSISKAAFFPFVTALFFAFLAFGGGLVELVHRWGNQEEYGHGFFIPLIAAWFLWRRRESLNESIGQPAWFGPVLVAVSIGMLLVGEMVALFLLIQLGFLFGVIGLVLSLGGVSLLRVTILPIALLVFAIPLPYFVDAQLSWRLQLVSSQLGVEFLRLVGTSVYLEGNVIDLGAYKLQVVDACSGLRYLYPLLSIGFLMAYMYRAPLWQRGVLFLSAVPITVLMNSLRIAVVGLLVERWGTEMAEGFLHYFEGWIIFLACLLALLAEIWVFERIGGGRSVLDAIAVPTIKPVAPRNGRMGVSPYPIAGALVMFAGAAVAVQVLDRREEIRPERAQLASFPLALGEWRAREAPLGEDVEKALGLDDYLLADYQHPTTGSVNFYVAYYGSQRKGVSPHSPQVCIPGGGWTISSLGRLPVTLPGAGELEVNRVVIDRGTQRQVVYYWFDQRGRQIANEYSVKRYLLQDALLRNRTDGALIRLTTAVLPGESPGAADRRLEQFMQLSVHKLAPYVPH